MSSVISIPPMGSEEEPTCTHDDTRKPEDMFARIILHVCFALLLLVNIYIEHFVVNWLMVFWIVAMTDCIVKVVSAFIKCALNAIPIRVLSNHRLGTAFTIIEGLSLLLRNVYPGLVWISFFLELGGERKRPLFHTILLLCLYGTLKLASLIYLGFHLKKMWSGLATYCHMICDKCVGNWCNRHTSCPVCDVALPTRTQWRDGSMDLFIQLY